MEFKVDRTDFLKIVEKAHGVVDKNPPKLILLNVFLESKDNVLEVRATDQAVSIYDQTESQTIIPGKITVEAKTLLSILRVLPNGTVSFVVDEHNWVTIVCGKSRYHLPGLLADEYPDIPRFPEIDDGIVLLPNILNSLVEKTSFAISGDEARPVLCGCYFAYEENELRMVATDGHRLSYARNLEVEISQEFKTIIPKKVVRELERILPDVEEDVHFIQNEVYQAYKLGNAVLIAKNIEGDYPNFKQVFPEHLEYKIVFPRSQMMDLLRRILLVLSERSHGMTLKVGSGMLQGFAESPDIGDATDEFEVEFVGEEMTVSYNPQYFLDILQIMDSEQVSLQLNDVSGPGILMPVGDETLSCIIMPMKLR